MTLSVQVGDAEERAPGPGVAGEEAALPAATRLLPALLTMEINPKVTRPGASGAGASGVSVYT